MAPAPPAGWAGSDGPPMSRRSITFCWGATGVGATVAVTDAAPSGFEAESGSSESSESLESLFVVEIPPNSAAAALAFLRSSLLSLGAGLAGRDDVVVAEVLDAALALLPPNALLFAVDVIVVLVSGAFVSSTGAAPHTFFTPLIAKEAD